MPEHFCLNHTDRPAVARCHRCHKPICEECALKTAEGVFCSQVCMHQFEDFRKKILPEDRGPGCLFQIVKSAVLLGIILFILFALARWGGLEWAQKFMQWLGIPY